MTDQRSTSGDVWRERLHRPAWGPVIVLGVLALLPFVIGQITLSQVQEIVIYALVAMGLNISFGFCGQLSLAQPVIMGVAAYATGIASVHAGWDAWATLPISLLSAIAVSFVLNLPAYRIRGWYLAVTSIFAAVVFPGIVTYAATWTGGTNGLIGIGPLPGAEITIGTTTEVFEIVLACAALAWWAMRNISTSSWGLVLRSVRDAPRAAQTCGINIRSVNFSVAVAAAIPVGLAGWLWAHTSFFLSSDDFSFNLVLLIIASVFLGGRGTMWGPILGVAVFESLSLLIGPFSSTNQLVLGLGLLVLAILAPHGLIAYLRTVESLLRPRLRALAPGLIAKLGEPVDVARRSARTLPRYGHADGDRNGPAATDSDGVGAMPQTGSLVVECRGVSKAFGGLSVLRDVDIEMRSGEVVGVVGPNGSGKTTLLNVATGFIRSDMGQVELSGRRLVRTKPWTIGRLGLRRSFQVPQLVTELSVAENIWLGLVGAGGRQRIVGSLVRGPWYRRWVRDGWRRVDETCAVLGFDESVRTLPASALPLGLRRVVEIGRCIVDPRVSAVCLDEPASGLSGEETVHLSEVIRLLARRGTAVLVIEHNLAFVRGTCDRIVQMDAGRLVSVSAEGDRLEDGSRSAVPSATTSAIGAQELRS